MRPNESDDIRHAISLRPLPFHLEQQHDNLRREHSATPTSRSEHRDDAIHRAPPYPAAAAAAAAADASPVDGAIAIKGHSTAYEYVDDVRVSATTARHGAAANANADADVEGQTSSPPRYTREHDPFHLSSKIKSAEEIELLRAGNGGSSGGGSGNGSGNGNGNGSEARASGASFCMPLTSGRQVIRSRKLQKFYENQNENIQRLLKPVDDHRREAKEADGENQLKYKIAVQGSFIANVILAALQLYAAAASRSLSLFTTMADALFDPLSNVTLILCNRAVNRVDGRRFPSGKSRIETAGNIVFCFIMVTVSVVIIVQSIRDLAAGSASRTTDFHLPAVIAVAIAFCTKLSLFFYCFALRNVYSQIRILWEDHRNDLLINGVGLMFSLLGSKVRWWIDPMGAILMSVLIISLWLRTAWSEFHLLIGVTADPHMLQLITYISMTHAPDIRAIDTVRAYYSGPRLIVEVDVVMDAHDSLQHTHDVAEDLQSKLESLPNVQRAYVHVDYETDHRPEHFLKKEL